MRGTSLLQKVATTRARPISELILRGEAAAGKFSRNYGFYAAQRLVEVRRTAGSSCIDAPEGRYLLCCAIQDVRTSAAMAGFVWLERFASGAQRIAEKSLEPGLLKQLSLPYFDAMAISIQEGVSDEDLEKLDAKLAQIEAAF